MAAGAVACTWPRSIDSPRSPTSGVLRESEAHPTGDSPWTAPGSEHARRAVREGAPCAVGFFQLQNSRKPRRCHVTTVSGVTMCTAVRQPRQACANHAHRRRSTNVRRRRGRRDRLMTASWCRRAMISRCSERRDWTTNRSEWSSETTTDDTTAGYRRMPITSIYATRTKFSVATSPTATPPARSR